MYFTEPTFNHPGETVKSLRETFAFIDTMSQRSDSTLMWASHGFMHFPGCDCDRNSRLYEQKFGAHQPCGDWWHQDEDQYANSMRTVPSAELDNGNLNLWRDMLNERDDALKATLSDRAFSFAAEKYFTHWKEDERYRTIHQ